MAMPVDGPIIREFARGRNNGIAIAADPGTPVRAAAAGQVAAVTENTDEVSIVVIKHPDNLLTVYVNLDDIAVSKGDSVGRGDQIAAVAPGSPSFLHFEVTRGTERVDPMPYLSP
jgi:murein DD-endopeptidase MepM/ murein hydrolase activator NlpD